MKKVLYINGNAQKDDLSFSSRAGKHYIDCLKKENQDVQVEVVNVYHEDIELIDDEILTTWGKLKNGVNFEDLDANIQKRIIHMNQVLEQFKNADEYLITSPLWNFGVPPMLKAYIDNICIAGETFKYSEKGPIGLMKNKKATVIQASGGIFSSEEASKSEHGSNFLKTVLNFVGVEDVTTILIEGLAIPDKSQEEKLKDALELVDNLF